MNKNNIYLGTISDIKNDKARVSIFETTTDFLPILAFASSVKGTHTPIKVGEQVIILAPYGEVNQGFILRGLYGAGNLRPTITEDEDIIEYKDGTVIKYNPTESILTIKCNDNVKIIAKGDIDIECENATLNAKSDVSVECSSASVKADSVLIKSDDVNLGASGGTGVVTLECTCSLTGNAHPKASEKVKAVI